MTSAQPLLSLSWLLGAAFDDIITVTWMIGSLSARLRMTALSNRTRDWRMWGPFLREEMNDQKPQRSAAADVHNVSPIRKDVDFSCKIPLCFTWVVSQSTFVRVLSSGLNFSSTTVFLASGTGYLLCASLSWQLLFWRTNMQEKNKTFFVKYFLFPKGRLMPTTIWGLSWNSNTCCRLSLMELCQSQSMPGGPWRHFLGLVCPQLGDVSQWKST